MTTPDHTPAPAEQCPVHQAMLRPDEWLLLPQHRRVVCQFGAGDDGAQELRLFCGDKEISFDEPELFAFGQTLSRQSGFIAGSATSWGSGYAWVQVQPLLQALLDGGVLQRVSGLPHAGHAHMGARAAPLPPGPCRTARLWSDGDAEELMRELTGRPLEVGWLEMVLPVFRVAHAALDSDGRQIGEANVFPKALRLDVPTQWRACIYSGTRYQPERPMNVSALKAMREHWGAMMQLLSHLRRAYLRRYPQCGAAGRGLTVGELERLASCVLALPTWLLMRRDAPVANGDLHPALSCLFRVTDGLRMTMHQMLFVPIAEPTLKPDALVSSADILAYAERNYSLHSEHGVCAGPQQMIEQFLAVLVDGVEVQPLVLDAALEQASAEIEPAIDYALHGLRVHAAVFSLWPAMARAYVRLNDVAQAWSATGGAAVQRLAARLQAIVDGLQQGTYLADEAWRADREAVYADMHAQCGAGLGMASDDAGLRGQLAPLWSCLHARPEAQLEALLQRRLARPDGSDGRQLHALRDALMVFLLQLQAGLCVATASQAEVNRLLGRQPPRREFDSADLDIVNLLQGRAERRLPYLVDELGTLLRLRVRVTAESITVTDLESETQPVPAAFVPNSTGMVPAE